VPSFSGEDERTPRQIQHKEDSTDWQNGKCPDIWLSCHRMQSKLPRSWYYPTIRSSNQINDGTDEIEDEQDYAPSLCPNFPTIQLF